MSTDVSSSVNNYDCFDCFRNGGRCDRHPPLRCTDCESSVDRGSEVRVRGQVFCYDCADEALGDLDYDDLEYGPPDSDPYDVDRDEYEPGGSYWAEREEAPEDMPSLEDHPMYDYTHNRNPYFPGEGY